MASTSDPVHPPISSHLAACGGAEELTSDSTPGLPTAHQAERSGSKASLALALQSPDAQEEGPSSRQAEEQEEAEEELPQQPGTPGGTQLLRPAREQTPAPAGTVPGGAQGIQPAAVVAGVVGGVKRLVVGAGRAPFMVLRSGLGLAGSTLARSVALGIGVAGFVGERLLPAPIIRGLGSALAGGERPPDARRQAHRFIQHFQATYGPQGPPWVPLELQQACVSALRDRRLLFAYLHSRQHEDVEQFCRAVLLDTALVAYLSQHCTCWAGDIKASDAHALSIRLGASTFPFIAILAMESDGVASVVKAAQGPTLMEPGALLQTVQRCVQEHRAHRRRAGGRATPLAHPHHQAPAPPAAAQQLLEAQQQHRTGHTLAEAAHVHPQQDDRAAAVVARRQASRASLPPEPAASAGVALVRVRLPDGSTAQRTFVADTDLRALFGFVDSLDAVECWNYRLVSTYPRQVFSHPDASSEGGGVSAHTTTLAALGLHPHATLFVQPVADGGPV